MPVLLASEDAVERWLDCAHVPLSAVAALMTPAETAPALCVEEVSSLVNSVAHDSPDCIVPVTNTSTSDAVPSSGSRAGQSATSRKRGPDQDAVTAPASPTTVSISDSPSSARRRITDFFVASSSPATAPRATVPAPPLAAADPLAAPASSSAWAAARAKLGTAEGGGNAVPVTQGSQAAHRLRLCTAGLRARSFRPPPPPPPPRPGAQRCLDSAWARPTTR